LRATSRAFSSPANKISLTSFTFDSKYALFSCIGFKNSIIFSETFALHSTQILRDYAEKLKIIDAFLAILELAKLKKN